MSSKQKSLDHHNKRGKIDIHKEDIERIGPMWKGLDGFDRPKKCALLIKWKDLEVIKGFCRKEIEVETTEKFSPSHSSINGIKDLRISFHK